MHFKNKNSFDLMQFYMQLSNDPWCREKREEFKSIPFPDRAMLALFLFSDATEKLLEPNNKLEEKNELLQASLDMIYDVIKGWVEGKLNPGHPHVTTIGGSETFFCTEGNTVQ